MTLAQRVNTYVVINPKKGKDSGTGQGGPRRTLVEGLLDKREFINRVLH